MQQSISYIATLLWRRFEQDLTAQEEAIVQKALSDPAMYPGFAEDITSEQQLVEWWLQEQGYQQAAVKAQVLAKIKNQIDENDAHSQLFVHRVHFLRRGWVRYAAALIILFGIGAYLWNNNKTRPKENTATITPSSHDILPGGQKAKLTLADGREIILDSAKNGQLANEHGSEIIKRGGEIIYAYAEASAKVYDAGQHRNEAVVFNAMSTPKGGQYQLTLPDGSKVWLNAASSIIYPTKFIGKTREVKIEGEVYFEIKANKNQPFIVKTTSEEIKVLGTEFNVNNYSDEPQSKISLINGAVKVNENILQPGQAYSNGKIIQTNIEQDVAWRSGYFYFVNADLPSVMRQIARWYDLEVKYDKGVAARTFEGKLSRGLSLLDVLDALSVMQIQYQLQGRTLTIQ